MGSEKYLPELMAEKDTLDPSFQHSLRLLDQEIEKIQKDEGKEEEKFIDVVINKNMKLGQKVLIPVKQFPKFNFVGKLLGPRGNSLKRLQEDTLTKMSILGKGSMRDKEKEEELRQSGEAKYHHLNEDLHVLIEIFAPPAEAYARMGHALEEIKKFLIPDYNDEIRQAQLQELTYLNGGSEDAKVPSVRGKSAARGRGTPVPGPPRSRGGVPPLHAALPRGAAPRGAPPSRLPSSRGRGVQRARGAPPATGYRPVPPIVQDSYGEYEYDDGYGTAYDDQGYESYDNNYSNQGQNSDDYYEYGHSGESYDSYGQEEWANNRSKAPSARTTKGVYRDQPYSRY
ncbi:KH domain-containing, RNA-binding, signal transduction-associated protein 3 [Haplochromis burtoni]|uniref:KH RNA binding domain containing, signal transduction associated 3 n=1 Tax=Haplochromis burtoni TaxID=8153 RepID=A0A3Q2WN12_HAPBU|nr:KH domain-containing, RNA-binding, signal transduction-associated protein 3 [Haplochromis burtoni]